MTRATRYRRKLDVIVSALAKLPAAPEGERYDSFEEALVFESVDEVQDPLLAFATLAGERK